MNRVRTVFVAALAVLFVSGVPTVAGAAQDSTGWITQCPGQVQAGIKIGSSTYIYGLWYIYQSQVFADRTGSAHWSAYRT